MGRGTRMKLPTCEFELKGYQNGFKYLAGCDEAGVGPLAGPVVAAAVIIKKDDLQQSSNLKNSLVWWSRVRDSKTVSEKERHALADLIKAKSFCYSVAVVSHETIDRLNILNAALTAMKQSVDGLTVKPDYLLIDGKHILKDVNDVVTIILGGFCNVLRNSKSKPMASSSLSGTLPRCG